MWFRYQLLISLVCGLHKSIINKYKMEKIEPNHILYNYIKYAIPKFIETGCIRDGDDFRILNEEKFYDFVILLEDCLNEEYNKTSE